MMEYKDPDSGKRIEQTPEVDPETCRGCFFDTDIDGAWPEKCRAEDCCDGYIWQEVT